jgi:hypothetical protein
MILPKHVLHADWSHHPAKRWVCHAHLHNGRYQVDVPVRAVPTTILADLESDSVVAGFDFPIGLPHAYAQRAGISSFLATLPHLGSGAWGDFFHVAAASHEIAIARPFYPHAPGGKRRAHLVTALGLATADDLYRECELRGQRACPLFWTLGGNQVGKAAITGWREVLQPALANPRTAIWPFAGDLEDLVARRGAVIVETYPGDAYKYVGATLSLVQGGRGKRHPPSRAACAPGILGWAAGAGVEVSDALEAEIRDGFGTAADGEDRFDALTGLLGMITVLQGLRAVGMPDSDKVRSVEGWILGRL